MQLQATLLAALATLATSLPNPTPAKTETGTLTARQVVPERTPQLGLAYKEDGETPLEFLNKTECGNLKESALFATIDKAAICVFYTQPDCTGRIGGEDGLAGLSSVPTMDLIKQRLGDFSKSYKCWLVGVLPPVLQQPGIVEPEIGTLVARQDPVQFTLGGAYTENGKTLGSLYQTECGNLGERSIDVWILQGATCVFYTQPDCIGRIGGEDGLAGQSLNGPTEDVFDPRLGRVDQRLGDFSRSYRCRVEGQSSTLVARQDTIQFKLGEAVDVNSRTLGVLYLTPCGNIEEKSDFAWIYTGATCVFYTELDCRERIGGVDGLAGQSLIPAGAVTDPRFGIVDQRLGDAALSYHCWVGSSNSSIVTRQQQSAGTIATRQLQPVGTVYKEDRNTSVGELSVIECGNLEGSGIWAQMLTGTKCVFYTEPDCNGQIGGSDGLVGISMPGDWVDQRLGAPAISYKCSRV